MLNIGTSLRIKGCKQKIYIYGYDQMAEAKVNYRILEEICRFGQYFTLV